MDRLSNDRLENAKRLFERALRLEPNNLDALSNLATFYAQKNRLSEAMPLLEKVSLFW